jgi:hypothetical protein
MINVTKEPSDAYQKPLKVEILEEISHKFMDQMLDMVNQSVWDALKKLQDTKNKEHEKTQKQISEPREDFNKHHSETKHYKKRYTN